MPLSRCPLDPSRICKARSLLKTSSRSHIISFSVHSIARFGAVKLNLWDALVFVEECGWQPSSCAPWPAWLNLRRRRAVLHKWALVLADVLVSHGVVWRLDVFSNLCRVNAETGFGNQFGTKKLNVSINMAHATAHPAELLGAAWAACEMA